MRLPAPLLRLFTAAFIAAGAIGNASASMVDWSTLTWAPGSLSNSYDVDPGTPGNDVTFTVSGSTGTLQPDQTSGVQTPAITTSLQGGTSPIQASLQLATNFVPPNSITLSINFSALYVLGVNGVSFTIFGIDKGGSTDVIQSISALGMDGNTYSATITNVGSAVSLTGSGLSQKLTGIAGVPNTGPSSDNGNATISFGATAIKSLTLTFANTPGGPNYQDIAISNILFNPIPEVDTGLVASLFCAVVAGAEGYRKRAAAKIAERG